MGYTVAKLVTELLRQVTIPLLSKIFCKLRIFYPMSGIKNKTKQPTILSQMDDAAMSAMSANWVFSISPDNFAVSKWQFLKETAVLNVSA